MVNRAVPSLRRRVPIRSISTSKGTAFWAMVTRPKGCVRASPEGACARVTSALPPTGGPGSSRDGSFSSLVTSAAALVFSASMDGALPQLSSKSMS